MYYKSDAIKKGPGTRDPTNGNIDEIVGAITLQRQALIAVPTINDALVSR